MSQILLVDTDDDLPAALTDAIARRTDLAVAEPADAGWVFDRVTTHPEEVAALVLGPGASDPLALARRAHAIDGHLSVVVLTPQGRGRELHEAIQLAPSLGEDVTTVEVADREMAAQRVIEAAERRRQRQAHSRVAAAVNRRIAEVTATPAVISDFGRLLDRAPIGVITVDPQGAICGCNDQGERALGQSERALLSESLPLHFAPDDRETVRDYLTAAVRGEEVAPTVFDRSAVHGQEQYLELSAVAAEIGPKQSGAIVLLRDVTAREQARRERDRTEEALRQQRRWYEATVLAIGDGVIATDAQGRVTLMNTVAEQLTGWSAADAVGMDSTRVFHIVNEASGEIVDSPIARVLREGVTVGLANHTILIARDGKRVPIDDSGAPIRNSEGAIAGVVLVFRDVSERRRSEQALRESERRFRAIFNQAASGIALMGPDGAHFTEVNDRFCELVGYSREELLAIDDPVGRLTHPDDLPTDRGLARELVAGARESYQREKRYLCKNGRDIWVRLAASALRDETGAIQSLIGVIEDITERKQAEDALQASEEHLRLVLSSLTNHAIFTMDLEGCIKDWSPAARHVLGYEEQEMIGRSGELIFTDEQRRSGIPEQELEKTLAEGQAVDDRWHVRKDGSLFWASGTVNLFGTRDAPRGFVKILRDQTESKQAQEQLEARARQQAAVASFGQRALSGVGLGELFDECVRLVADTLEVDLCKILRLIPEEGVLRLEAGVGWPEGAVGYAQVGAGPDSQAGATLRSDHPIIVEDLRTETRFSGPPLLREQGVISGMSVIIAGDAGEPWGVLGTHSRQYRRFTDDDVNFLQAMGNTLAAAIGRSRSERRLRELNRTLEQRVAERTAETEQRAAQLRALTSELTQTEQRERRRLAQALHDHLQQMLVAAKLQLGGATKHAVDDESVEALQRVNDLLDQSIQESRSLTVELSPPVLYDAGLVAGLDWLGRWMEEQHGLSLELHTSEEAEPAGEDLRVLLFQAARELLFNVVKHTEVDRAAIDLRRDERGRIEMRVSDRGAGFDPRNAKPAEEETSERGFGLFSIRERLARLGGELAIESSPGEGTQVSVVLPDQVPEAAEDAGDRPPATQAAPAEIAEAERPAAPLTTSEGVIRVVIADDHAIVREGLVGVLNGQPDIDVVAEASDGQAVLDLVRENRPDVVVLDVTMPHMNGIEAARILSDEFPQLRIIGLSVHESSDMAGAMRKAGAEAYLNKAGPSNRLLAAIRSQAIS